MTSLSDTLATLARYRRNLEQGALAQPAEDQDGLSEITHFGANPGALRMMLAVPARLPRHAPLVVAMHGCTQTAASYDHGAGWSELAQRFGFALLLPQQRRENNAGGCFNWFQPDDITRGHGEAASVRAMIEHAITHHGLDRRRVFITGLSAGAAFANVMLATYPELFAGGALIAGLPYGGARDMASALRMMSQGQQRPDHDWGDLVRAASAHRGAWPRISVWHGAADTTVVPANGTDTVRQWLDVQGLAFAKAERSAIGSATRLTWGVANGAAAVELITVPGLGHAVPISAHDAERGSGTAGAFIADVGIPSSFLIAEAWGLTRAGQKRAAAAAPHGSVVERALRAAGLMK